VALTFNGKPQLLADFLIYDEGYRAGIDQGVYRDGPDFLFRDRALPGFPYI
jgi:hypothetical protein